VGAADGHVLAAVRETASGDAELLAAIDKLSKKLRERVGESLVTIRQNPRLDQVTTASLPALRRYSQALRLDEEGRPEEAIPLLQNAVELDSGFAMAYRKLAVLLTNSGAASAGAAAATRAFAHRDRLPELEANLATAFYYFHVDYDRSKTIAAYRAALTIDPENSAALNNLSIAYQDARQFAEAESLSQRATRVARGAVLYENLLQAQVAQGHFEDARRTLERHAAAAPGNPFVLSQRARLAIAQGDYAAGARLAEQLRAAQRDSPLWQARTATGLSRLSRLQGRIRESERYLRELMALGDTGSQPDVAVRAAAEIAMLDAEFRNRPDSGLAILEQALARHPLASMPATDRPYPELIVALTRLGRLEQARRLKREFESEVPLGMRRHFDVGYLAAGVLAEAEGHTAESNAAYRAANDAAAACLSCGLFEQARIADRAGHADSALTLYDRGMVAPSLDRWLWDAYSLPEALKRSGELYEAKGDRAKASDRYRRFVELWKNADPELQPGVREVRERLARLATETPS
jgi:tetratricopeptide (TPR) repeat protein